MYTIIFIWLTLKKNKNANKNVLNQLHETDETQNLRRIFNDTKQLF